MTNSTLRVYTLTDQEARIVYAGLDAAMKSMQIFGAPDEQIHVLIALRERFYIEEEDQA